MTVVTSLPASIRHKNPGAMGLGASAKLFGASKNTRLNDGAGNVITTFATSVDGAGALFHLLYTVYEGMTISDAISKWSGRTNVNSYLRAIEQNTQFTRGDYVSAEWLKDPEPAIEFAKAMAKHEAGVEYPMTDAQWAESHQEFMSVISGRSILLDRRQPPVTLAPLQLARAAIGEREIPGPRDHNEFIVSCFADIGSAVRDDETSWCAAFAGAMLKRSNCAYLPSVLEARKYLQYGHALDEPEEGCLVVFWRESPSSWKGHVAFVESFTADTLTIIGGNQSNAVTRLVVARTGPKSQVIGYRRPVPAVTPAREVLADTSIQRKIVGAASSVGMFLWSIWDYVTNAAHAAGELVGLLPDTAAKAGDAIATGQSLFHSAGVPWPVSFGLLIVISSIAFNAVDTWRRKRKNTGELTTAPYETDEPPPLSEMGVAADVFSTTEAATSFELSGKVYTRAQVQDLLKKLGTSQNAKASADLPIQKTKRRQAPRKPAKAARKPKSPKRPGTKRVGAA